PPAPRHPHPFPTRRSSDLPPTVTTPSVTAPALVPPSAAPPASTPPPTTRMPSAVATSTPPSATGPLASAIATPAAPAPSARFTIEFGPFFSTAEAERLERRLMEAGYPTVRSRRPTGGAVYAVLIERVP